MSKRRANKQIVQCACIDHCWVSDIQGALGVDIIAEYLCSKISLGPDEEDSHTWCFSASRQYSSKSAYKEMFSGDILFEPWDNISRYWAPEKNSFLFFVWLLIKLSDY